MSTKHSSDDGIADGIFEASISQTQYPRGFYGSVDNRVGVTGTIENHRKINHQRDIYVFKEIPAQSSSGDGIRDGILAIVNERTS